MPCNCLLKDFDNKNIPCYKKQIFIFSIIILIILIITVTILIIKLKPNSKSDINTNPSKKSDNFTSESFIESIKPIFNPDQGFFRSVYITMTPDSFVNKTNKPIDDVYHLRCDISHFSKVANKDKDKELTDIALNGLDEYLNKLKIENKNAVIRFAYDPGFNGNENNETSLEMMEKHIKQLSPILDKHYHTLIAIEAGMIGPWGEMHSSDIATDENKAKVFQWWLENTHNIPILGRYPKSLFYYFNKTLDDMEKYDINSTNKGYLLGIFNDCFLSGERDVGTYRFNRTREIEWLSKQNEHLPFGGETCEVYRFNDLDYAIPEMFKLKISYLNSGYKKEVIAKWNNTIYNSSMGKDLIFYGVSGYNYIKTHLGYRLVIISINVLYNKGADFDLIINIKNVGFGNLLKEKYIDIIYTDTNNDIISKKENLGKYKGEERLVISSKLLDIENEEYKVFVKLCGLKENNNDYYCVQFANEKLYDANIKANYIFKVFKGEVQI